MPDTVSIIRAKGKPLSVEAERKQHSDWVKQEAQLLMDDLFSDLQDPAEPGLNDSLTDAVDVDWVDGLAVSSSQSLSHSWASLDTDEVDDHWVKTPESTPFYRRFLLVFAGLAAVTPLSLWGMSTLKDASQPRSVIAAPPSASTASDTQASDQDFAQYAEQALRQIEVQSESTRQKPAAPKAAVGITALPTLKIGDRTSAVPPVLPPMLPTSVASASATTPSPLQASAAKAPAAAPSETQKASQAEIDRLALRVFKPNKAVKSEVPAVSSNGAAETVVNSGESLPAPPSLSSITPAPESDLPTLAANIAEPNTQIAAATPMNSPESASKKVIGIVELGLQSTLMVSNNGSHLNFQVGDTVNDEGWKLVQIAQGKAILQKGAEYKTLSEGQYF